MRGKSLLETGCGKGGGTNYLMNAVKPSKCVGVDLSPQCINFCKENWQTFQPEDM